MGNSLTRFYSPSSLVRNIANTISEKIHGVQANRFVVNLNGTQVTTEMLQQQIADYPISGLAEIITIENGSINFIY
ncbi:MAG: hypothetical protein V7K88_12515 [Nostoc sp.]|uniref:CdiA C-terminal domain-containing protein n=1 Tax=Nostoc sp. TaxID=1180 RepID=UPI002FFA013C